MTDIKLIATFYSGGIKKVLKMTGEAWDNIKSNPRKHLQDMAHDFKADKFDFFIVGK